MSSSGQMALCMLSCLDRLDSLLDWFVATLVAISFDNGCDWYKSSSGTSNNLIFALHISKC